MKKFTTWSFGIAIVLIVSSVLAQTAEPTNDRDAPARNQQWLSQLVGEWDIRFNLYVQPDQPPMVATGTESVRAIGEYWAVAETSTTMMGAPFSGMLTLGYDPQVERFKATWVDSMSGYLWIYEGTLNEAGDTLTLEAKGPIAQNQNESTRYRAVITVTGENSRTFASSVEREDGQWMTGLEIEYRRKASEPRTQQDRSTPDPEEPLKVHYLEIVTPETDATCNVLEHSQGVSFGEPAAELGNARTANLKNGGRIGVRAPMGEEQPVVRPYVLVDDIRAAVKAAEAAGAEMIMPPTEIPGQGTFAIYYLGKIEHGLWQNP